MSKTLVIVESPAKAKTISKFLGKKYMVKASMGHVRDLPKSQFGVDVSNGFNPKYITIRGKGNTIKDLRAAEKKADQVLIASDPDREGEAIAWHLQNILEIPDDEPCRIEFNEITKQAIQSAVTHPRVVDADLVNAQQARRILDRLVGYNLSPLLWRKVKKGLSAGRVQSVAVRLICDREEEIESFEPEEYWTLTGSFIKTGSAPFEGKLYKYLGKKIDIDSAEKMREVLDSLKGTHYTVTKVTRKEKNRKPAPPFITSTLQQEAYRKLNFTSRKTMMIAQQLYEGLDLGKEGTSGLVTYIRTDSTRVSETARSEAQDYLRKRLGAHYVGKNTPRPAGKGKIQDAHEAIRPTSVNREPDLIKSFLTNDQYKLYKLIWSRFLASQMSQAVFDTTSVDISAGDYMFRATGSVIKFPGFMQVYTESRDDGEKDEEKLLPELSEGESVEARSLTPKQHYTQPPPRYTDATLVKTLEEKGIGRPSTYAPIVETVIKRGYVVRENKQLYPTELGTTVVDLLKKHFLNIIDIEFTAGMEEELDRIEEGTVNWVQVLDKFYTPFNQTLLKADKEIGRVQVADEVTDEICEQCGRNMVIKMGRYGKFLACPGFPECRNTRPLLEPTGVGCPRCEGELVARRSKKGRKFYGCSRYPECDFTIWDQPAKVKCPVCGGLMIEKKGAGKKITLRCINEKCSNKDVANSKVKSRIKKNSENKVENISLQ
ncbi:MAG: DNA topoisomerase 1 [Pelotomaculum sp. PtaB.Bin013]|uniref:DNA topoisomerase 1 n=1 Tax=Pelotomaculum isophthalicicum JI TaxID=947010 RepID=A0A9X4H3Z6_9FIRM|nr:type I DNA topoisomerase [Pelotomaculum isophthalicicum]MDF9407262.1 type I DNA topoisomerase [Pelotomaculum isophthalicicum JI]OPX92075.1 MAG: DNA topoisomerase 1 [Pelotomaculum sp. PtaB.Bin013]